MRVSFATDQWLSRQHHLAPSTLATYERDAKHVRRLWGDRSVRRLDMSEVAAGLSGLSASKQRRVLGVLRLVLDEHRDPNPARKVKVKGGGPKPVTAVPTIDEIEAMAEAMGCPSVLTMAATGMRYGEMAALQREHIDPARQQVRVMQAQCPTTLAFRQPKSKSGVRTLVYLARWEEPLASAPRPFGPYAGHAYNKLWKRAQRETGTKFRVHDLRHWYATHLLREGVPIPTVSHWLGHSSPSVTLDVYAHWVDEDYTLWRGRL